MIDICLQNDIKRSSDTTIVEGRLLKVDSVAHSSQDAIKVAMMKIPSRVRIRSNLKF